MSQMLHGCLADTDYQVVRARSGHEYGVWVTTPPGYADSDDRLPLVYVVDGNWTVGLTAPLIVATADPFLSVKPYVQVTVGYAGDEAASWANEFPLIDKPYLAPALASKIRAVLDVDASEPERPKARQG